MLDEYVDLITFDEGLGRLLQSEGSFLEGHPEIGADYAEEPPVYFVHNVSWNSLREWLDSRHILLDGSLEYEVRDGKDGLVRLYKEGRCYEGPDPLQRVWNVLKREIDECASRVDLPVTFRN